MRTIRSALYVILYTIYTYPLRIIYRNMNITKEEKEEKCFKLLRKLVIRVLKISGINVSPRGQENINKEETYLIISNHKSLLDCLVLISIMEEPFIFIGKKELEKVPIISGWFKDIGCIFMDRDNIRTGMRAILAGANVLKSGKSVVIFPEGKIIFDQKLGEFKSGSFKLAVKANVKILPISVGNFYKLLEEKKKIIKGKAHLIIGKEIDWEKYGYRKTEELRDRALEVIRENYRDISLKEYRNYPLGKLIS